MTDGGRTDVRRLTRLRLAFALLLVALVTLDTVDAMAPQDTIYVVRQGWHPGLVLPMPLAEPLLVGELEGERPRYVEIGWGDAAYYRDPEPGLGTLLRAALLPTAGTVQIVPVWTSVERFARGADLYGYVVPDSLLTPLLAYLMAEIALEEGDVVDQGPSLYGAGRFFAATRRYNMFNNSNHWAARALRIAGCDLSVWQSLIIELLFIQLRECGFEIEPADLLSPQSPR